MDIKKLNNHYQVKKLTPNDLEDIYDLSISNPLYYEYCIPFITKDMILEDMISLPPNKTLNDKFYVGFYDKERLICVLDLILSYPDQETSFIGFFMVHKDFQSHGLGSKLVGEILTYMKSLGYRNARLGYVKGNMQAKNFWLKQGFSPTGVISKQTNYDVIVMQKTCI